VIKLKGVCNLCKKEFDLTPSSFYVSIDPVPGAISEINITIMPLSKGNIDADRLDALKLEYVVCGKHCLFKHIDTSIGGDNVVMNGNETEIVEALKFDELDNDD
jgi:hypothetical protein